MVDRDREPEAEPRDYDEDMRIPGATPELLTESVVSGGAARREPETKSDD